MTKERIKTELLYAGPDDPPGRRAEIASRAAEVLTRGGLVAVPTDTVAGIAVRGDRQESVDRLYALKGRPLDKSLTVHLGAVDEHILAEFVPSFPPVAQRLAHHFWPGALTLVVPGNDGKLVGLRVPDHPLLQEILLQAPIPILIPSANKSGAAPTRDMAKVLAEFGGQIEALVDDTSQPAIAVTANATALASTVVMVRPDSWEVMREGAIAKAEIKRAAMTRILLVCTGNTCRSPMAAALLQQRLAERLGVEDIAGLGLEVASYGVSAADGAQASDGSTSAMQRRGLTLRDHRSRQLDAAAVHDATVIYVMTRSHIDAVLDRFAGAPVALLDRRGEDISDPIGGSLAVYEETARQLESAIDDRIDQVLAFAGIYG